MKTSEQLNELAPALAKAQADFPPIEFDAVNPHFKSRYATLAAIRKAVQPVLGANGLSTIQSLDDSEPGQVTCTTRLLHQSGQWVECSVRVPTGKDNAHGVGSAITYGRRYTLSAILGVVADDDDDANGAVEAKPKPAKRADKSSPIEDKLAQSILEKVREKIEAASTEDELQAVIENAKKLPEGLRSEARKLFKAKKAELKSNFGPPALSDDQVAEMGAQQ